MKTGVRVNPNTDMIGGHAGLGVRAVARTLRLSREWRKHGDTQIGPLRDDVVEPFRDVHLTLGGPEGTVGTGMAQIEMFLNRRYEPYGFKNPTTMAGRGLVGRSIV
jgi:hypothetical protein